jgi:hypothetical protein
MAEQEFEIGQAVRVVTDTPLDGEIGPVSYVGGTFVAVHLDCVNDDVPFLPGELEIVQEGK